MRNLKRHRKKMLNRFQFKQYTQQQSHSKIITQITHQIHDQNKIKSLTHQRHYIPKLKIKHKFQKFTHLQQDQQEKQGLNNHYTINLRQKQISFKIRRHSQQKYNKLQKIQKNQSNQLLQQGKQYFKQNQMDSAIIIFKQILNKNYLGSCPIQSNKNSQILYFLGSAFLNKQKYQTCIIYLNQLISKNPHFSKNSYLLLSIAFKKLKQYKSSLKILLKAIQYFPNFQQAYIYAAKIYMKLKLLTNASQYFLKANDINSQNPLTLIGLADCLRIQGLRKQAINLYTRSMGLQESKYRLVCILKRLSAYYEQKKYIQAQKDVDQLIKNDVKSSEVYYFKGILLTKKNQISLLEKQKSDYHQIKSGETINQVDQPTIYFQMALSLNNHKKAVTKSFQAIILSKIKQLDFYQAYHNLQRLKYLSINYQEIQNLVIFIQGINDSIKQRYNQAIKKLQQLNGKLQKGFSFNRKINGYQHIIKQMLGKYIGYCYFAIGKYSKALKHLDKNNKNYNKLICQGILSNLEGRYNQATIKFQEAKTAIGYNKVEPFLYKAVNYMQNLFKNQKNDIIKQNNQQFIKLTHQQLKMAITIKTNNSLFLFYYAMIQLYRGQTSLNLINQAIQKSDDNVAEYFFIRAINLALAGKFQDAIQDYNNAIFIDNLINQFYKERSKCFYLLSQFDEAILDIRKSLQLKQQDYQCKLLLCFYLYASQKYELAVELLQKIAQQQVTHTKLINLLYALYFRLTIYEKAGLIGQLMISIVYGRVLVPNSKQQYYQLIGQFDLSGLLLLQGIHYYYKQDYDNAYKKFQQSLIFIQNNLNENQKNFNKHQLRIFQLKFNIIFIHIAKGQIDYALQYVTLLKQDTIMKQLFLTLNTLQLLLKNHINSLHNQILAQETTQIHKILAFENTESKFLISKLFPILEYKLKPNIIIKTRLLLHQPDRIKFNIRPQFNYELLKQFDMRKIQDRPEPPWIKRNEQHIVIQFTEAILNEEVIIQNSEQGNNKSPTIQRSIVFQDEENKIKLKKRLSNI